MSLTRSQIRNKIYNLEAQKNNYVKERDKYKTSLTHANKLLRSLSNSNVNLSSSKEYLGKYFNINGKTPDNGKLDASRNELSKMANKVSGTIIPKINNEISRLDRNINNLQYQINSLWRDYNNAKE